MFINRIAKKQGVWMFIECNWSFGSTTTNLNEDSSDHLDYDEPSCSYSTPSKKAKIKSKDSNESSQIMEYLSNKRATTSEELFLKSLAPDLEKLDEMKKSNVKLAFQGILHAAKFGGMPDVMFCFGDELSRFCAPNDQRSYLQQME